MTASVEHSIRFNCANWERVKSQLIELQSRKSSTKKGFTGPVRYCDKKPYYPVSAKIYSDETELEKKGWCKSGGSARAN